MRTGELYQRYYGHYVATVVDIEDPDKLGRIRLQADQFADTSDQPMWASICRPSAGDKQGVFFTPKKGDQVIISYLAGDVREPMVVGYAHSKQNMPDADKVSPEKHGIVTTIGSVIFDEKKGTITVTLDGPTKSTVTMDKDKNKGVTIEFNPEGTPKASITLNNDSIKLVFKGPPESSITIDKSAITLKATDVKVQVDNALDVS